MEVLEGKKTYLGLIVWVLLHVALAFKYVDAPFVEQVKPYVLAWLGYGYYDKLKRG